jgi:hypothetical protein
MNLIAITPHDSTPSLLAMVFLALIYWARHRQKQAAMAEA